MNKVDLQGIVGGALQEKFQKSIERVVENLQDPNTSFKNKRVINIRLGFQQNEARDEVTCDIDVTEKLAPQAAIKTQFAVGKDIRSGQLYIEEYGKQIKGQMNFNDYESDVEFDTQTGEILEDKEGVIDFRKVRVN